MFDYNGWIKEAEHFISRVAQTKEDFRAVDVEISIQESLSREELHHITNDIGFYIPKELQNFWLQAARSCNIRYVCFDATGQADIYGEIRFFDPLKLSENLDDCKEWAGIFMEYPDPAQSAIWLNSLPFQEISNGDYLGLDISIKDDNPPVIYLSHDGDSQIIASSFTSFLSTWADLCYIGPENWILEPFQDEKGWIDSTSQKADSLRKRLRCN